MPISLSAKLLAHIRRRPLVPLLLAATVCVDAVGFLLELPKVRTTEIQVSWAGLLCGQLGLLAMWCSWRLRYWTLRVLLTIAGVLLFGLCIDEESSHASYTSFATFGGVYAGLVALMAWGVRLGIRHYEEKSESRSNRWRFSVAFMLALMTVIAVVAALSRGMDFQIISSTRIIVLVFIEALLAGICLALTRRIERPLPVILTTLLIVTLIAIIAGNVVGPRISFKNMMVYAIFLTTAAAQYLAWLFAVRVRCTPRKKLVSRDALAERVLPNSEARHPKQ